jgi:hypothetical protein
MHGIEDVLVFVLLYTFANLLAVKIASIGKDFQLT